MYWDVVEVRPERDYCLFVRFKDGLAGCVRLRREDLTGALAPLLDERFFEQVFIDYGAVAWPGEIDLAPDSMYAQIANRLAPEPSGEVVDRDTLESQLPRLYELKDLIPDPSNPNAYFQSFEIFLQDPIWLETFIRLEQRLQRLEPKAWESLRSKASPYLSKKNPTGRGWQQLFDVLDGEVSAYNYLRESVGCSKVCFIPASRRRTPDLEGFLDSRRVLCEVKTINISDDEIKTRCGPPAARDVYNPLGAGFFGKLDSDIKSAKTQLENYDSSGEAFHLVYLRICFDDRSGIYDADYFAEIKQHLMKCPPGIKVVASAGSSNEATHVIAEQ